jgi:hypothetical protein
MKKFFFISIFFILFFSLVNSASAYVASSPNYRLEKDSLNVGGTDFSTSGNYSLSDTLGELASGLGLGGLNNASTGYRYMEIDPTPLPLVLGCMDSSASNYNALATQSDGSCQYPPIGGCIGLCPVFGCTNPNAFNYNSLATQDDGSCTNIIEGVLGCIDPLANNYNPLATEDNGSCTYPPIIPPGPGECIGSGCGGSFSSLPVASTTLSTINNLKWALSFIQPEESVKTFDWRGMVRLAGSKPVSILLKFNMVVPSLKTIGVTLSDPYDKNKFYSFLMHRSDQGLTYEATLSPLLKPGVYPIDIYIINYENQTIQHIKGRLVIPNPTSPWLPVVGLLVGFTPLLFDFWNLLIRLFSYLLGRRRHDKPWGTVYDSETKQPLDPVYVTAETTGPDGKMKEVASAITDIDGRFSFFLPDGTYYLKANKTHYKFPSNKLGGREWDELYRNLYFGAPIVVTDNNVVNLNIPMDSVDFDWNEFAKTKTNFFRFYDRRKLWLNRLYKLFFSFGFILSVYAVALDPTLVNFVITALYLALIVFNLLWRDKYKPLRVFRESTGLPLSFAILRVFIPNLNQQIKSVAADKFGNFYLLVRHGVYYYTVEEKLPDGSYLKVYQSEPLNFKDGILTRDVSVK